MVKNFTISKKLKIIDFIDHRPVKDYSQFASQVRPLKKNWHGFGPIDSRNPVKGTSNRILNIRNINIHIYEHN